jgi:hypothetical protein
MIKIWRYALAAFILAGLTGALYRYMVAFGGLVGVNLINVRHAHTHLMYFSWATPALFALIAVRIRSRFEKPVPVIAVRAMWASLLLGLAAYGSFLAFGYQPVAFGSARIPPSVILAGLNMIAWYGFVAGYRIQTKGIERTRGIRLLDTSLIFLVLATLGAWGISIIAPLGLNGELWPVVMTHIFLEFFTEGWLMLAVIGLIYLSIREPEESSRALDMAGVLLVVGICVSVLLGLPRSLVPIPAQVLARFGGSFMSVGLLIYVRVLWTSGPHWRAPSIFLALKTAILFIVCVTPMIWWSDFYAERILYLHLHLLGFVTVGIITVAARTWPGRWTAGRAMFTASVTIVLISLLPMTFVIPASLRGGWVLYGMAAAAPLPVLAAIALLVRSRGL